MNITLSVNTILSIRRFYSIEISIYKVNIACVNYIIKAGRTLDIDTKNDTVFLQNI